MIGGGEGRVGRRMFIGQRPSTWLALALCTAVCVVVGPDLAAACPAWGACKCKVPDNLLPVPLSDYRIASLATFSSDNFMAVAIVRNLVICLVPTVLSLALSYKWSAFKWPAIIGILASGFCLVHIPNSLVFFYSPGCGDLSEVVVRNGTYSTSPLNSLRNRFFLLVLGAFVTAGLYVWLRTYDDVVELVDQATDDLVPSGNGAAREGR
jgi:hypothetical protein